MARNRHRAFRRHSISQPHQGFHLQALNQDLVEGLWLLPLQGNDCLILSVERSSNTLISMPAGEPVDCSVGIFSHE